MWGDGTHLPTGNAFERQFEAIGLTRSEEVKYYIYRKNLEGRGVKVVPDEYREITNAFFWSSFRRWFWTILIYVIFTPVFYLLEPAFSPDDDIGLPIIMGTAPAAIYYWLQRKRDWQRAECGLVGRPKAGLDRSPEDAKILRRAITGWLPIERCILVVMVPVVVVIDTGPTPGLRDLTWLVPLGAVIIGGLGWWSIVKARAIRAYREMGK